MRFCRPLRFRSISIRRNCLRAVGTGFGSAWLRAGLSIGPILVGVRGLRGGRACRWTRNTAVRDRDQRQDPRGVVILTSCPVRLAIALADGTPATFPYVLLIFAAAREFVRSLVRMNDCCGS